MGYEALSLMVMLGNTMGFTLTYFLMGRAWKWTFPKATEASIVMAGIMSGLLFSLPGLIILLLLWDILPKRVKVYKLAPAWTPLTTCITLAVLFAAGLCYESLVLRRGIWSLLRYAFSESPRIICASLLGSALLAIVIVALDRLRVFHGHRVQFHEHKKET
ncbi:MAG: hypothetical protein DRN15_08205 [Thermoprotei archaeon]|nr:MAG: hypothetical protein DRN15_08205 [Thermoprotei archaeon]RLF24834.1 MAG: hypothetical protein DRM97_02915 [Thermoprotei archaeon]